jgi:uncharacterized DUF497 family protein
MKDKYNKNSKFSYDPTKQKQNERIKRGLKVPEAEELNKLPFTVCCGDSMADSQRNTTKEFTLIKVKHFTNEWQSSASLFRSKE